MTNIGHFRAAGKLLEKTNDQLPTRLWVAPPTKMDAAQLTAEGYYGIFGKVGARLEMPGCSLCMGNQVRALTLLAHPRSTWASLSTRPRWPQHTCWQPAPRRPCRTEKRSANFR
jgi:aconitate hydratase 2/2-methylisocitrate dehydratase